MGPGYLLPVGYPYSQSQQDDTYSLPAERKLLVGSGQVDEPEDKSHSHDDRDFAHSRLLGVI